MSLNPTSTTIFASYLEHCKLSSTLLNTFYIDNREIDDKIKSVKASNSILTTSEATFEQKKDINEMIIESSIYSIYINNPKCSKENPSYRDRIKEIFDMSLEQYNDTAQDMINKHNELMRANRELVADYIKNYIILDAILSLNNQYSIPILGRDITDSRGRITGFERGTHASINPNHIYAKRIEINDDVFSLSEILVMRMVCKDMDNFVLNTFSTWKKLWERIRIPIENNVLLAFREKALENKLNIAHAHLIKMVKLLKEIRKYKILKTSIHTNRDIEIKYTHFTILYKIDGSIVYRNNKLKKNEDTVRTKTIPSNHNFKNSYELNTLCISMYKYDYICKICNNYTQNGHATNVLSSKSISKFCSIRTCYDCNRRYDQQVNDEIYLKYRDTGLKDVLHKIGLSQYAADETTSRLKADFKALPTKNEGAVKHILLAGMNASDDFRKVLKVMSRKYTDVMDRVDKEIFPDINTFLDVLKSDVEEKTSNNKTYTEEHLNHLINMKLDDTYGDVSESTSICQWCDKQKQTSPIQIYPLDKQTWKKDFEISHYYKNPYTILNICNGCEHAVVGLCLSEIQDYYGKSVVFYSKNKHTREAEEIDFVSIIESSMQ